MKNKKTTLKIGGLYQIQPISNIRSFEYKNNQSAPDLKCGEIVYGIYCGMNTNGYRILKTYRFIIGKYKYNIMPDEVMFVL